jgi:lipopolysaccharide/colanic/teichoic acid biosynthesis glycosyltransferase
MDDTMHLILTQPDSRSTVKKTADLMQLALSDSTLAPVVLHGLQQTGRANSGRAPVVLLPQQWRQGDPSPNPQTAFHNGSFHFHPAGAKKTTAPAWAMISNGRYSTSFSHRAIGRLLTALNDDLILIEVAPSLSANYEKMLFTSAGNVAGFCRRYSDSMLPAAPPAGWPHHLFIKQTVLDRVFSDGTMPLKFQDFYGRCEAEACRVRCLNIGGTVLDLQHPDGMLAFVSTHLSDRNHALRQPRSQSDIPASTRIYGRVLIGDHVHLGNNVILIGPTVLCNHATVADGAVINGSVIGPHGSVKANHIIKNRVIDAAAQHTQDPPTPSVPSAANPRYSTGYTPRLSGAYRTWPLLSYPRLLKRAADILASLGVLLLLAPVFPVIAVAVKLSSTGPVFFKHQRQGRHGKPFNCLKFRTMIPGADNIQDKLRMKNQVDGPQFMMEDDPRVTAVGRFLRDTYIDELPQFINVLAGQMSVIGPRPSPEKENSQCPIWHDARLSVRPGISGLWQIERTRLPGRDFQEWIYYDIEYIRHLSLKMDLQICWKTVKKIATTFFTKF